MNQLLIGDLFGNSLSLCDCAIREDVTQTMFADNDFDIDPGSVLTAEHFNHTSPWSSPRDGSPGNLDVHNIAIGRAQRIHGSYPYLARDSLVERRDKVLFPGLDE